MLRVNNIDVVYMNVIQVLRGVSLDVGDGKIVALLGANGGGKTSTLKAISGMLKTEEGEVLLSSAFIDVSEVPTIIQLDLLKDWIEGLTELYSNTLESFETRH